MKKLILKLVPDARYIAAFVCPLLLWAADVRACSDGPTSVTITNPEYLDLIWEIDDADNNVLASGTIGGYGTASFSLSETEGANYTFYCHDTYYAYFQGDPTYWTATSDTLTLAITEEFDLGFVATQSGTDLCPTD